MKKILIALALTVAVAGCTDAEMADLGSYGSQAEVKCWSGGQVIFDEETTGKVSESSSGAGLYFRSKATGKFVHTYADCVVFSE